MALFPSERGSRYWLYIAAVLVAIYSTLGVTPKISGALRENGLLEPAFALGMVLVLAAIILPRINLRPSGAELGVIIGIIAVYLLMVVRMDAPLEERTHLIEYGVVGAFVFEALNERTGASRRILATGSKAIALTAGLGVIDEMIQAVLPNRMFDPLDILFNILAGAMAVAARVAISLIQKTSSLK